ncbi:hypothetical protein D9M68_907660 [compost metagenome]
MQMENATQSAMTYAMGRGQPLEAGKARELASNLERVLVSRIGNDITSKVDVNHGAQRSYAGKSSSEAGNLALAGSCYCPSMGSTGVSWNGAMVCGRPCTDGGSAGKFVYIEVSKPFSPIFGGYGLVENGQLRLQTLGRIE